MGFWDIVKSVVFAKKEYLLEWQRLLLPGSHKLSMNEQQLKAATIQCAENDLRIIDDCARLIEQTTNPEVFFMRLNLLIEKLNRLMQFEKYIKFSGSSPTAAYNEACQNYQMAIYHFLIRYYSETFDKACAMKTEKGRIGKYQKFYDSLQKYYRYMSAENTHYIETKYEESKQKY